MSDFTSSSDLSMGEIVAKMRRLVGADGSPTASAAADHDVLELTQAIQEDGSTRHLRPFGTAAAEVAVPAPAAGVPTQGGVPAPQPEGLSNLGSRTLEDLVGELLRPMLQRWFDDNLPGIVERLVQAEVARRVRLSSGPSGGSTQG